VRCRPSRGWGPAGRGALVNSRGPGRPTIDLLILDWLNIGLRWVHLIAGIGWLGTSLYFMWLDAALIRTDPPRGDVEGHTWLLHSGGFYLVERRTLPPGQLPSPIHWFKWEAAMTWLTGFPLLVLVYYLTRGVYLVEPTVSAITPGQAVALGIGVLIVGWAVYDLLWSSPLARGSGRAAVIVSWVLLLAVVYALTHVLSGRAAYIHTGAMLGTIMVANVWMRIVPAQRELVAAAAAWRGRARHGGARVGFVAAKEVIDRRCVSCHSDKPSDDVFRIAPNGVTFETAESIRARAETIRARVVVLRNMPLANKTGMTEAERDLIARWLDQGASIDGGAGSR